MKRWLTTFELGETLAKRDPRIAQLSRKRRNEYALRLVRRAERYDGVRCTKRVGKNVLVSVVALEELLPTDAATVDRLDVEFGKLNQEHRQLKVRIGDHGSKLTNHARRIVALEEKEAARRDYEARCAEIDRRANAAG